MRGEDGKSYANNNCISLNGRTPATVSGASVPYAFHVTTIWCIVDAWAEKLDG